MGDRIGAAGDADRGLRFRPVANKRGDNQIAGTEPIKIEEAVRVCRSGGGPAAT